MAVLYTKAECECQSDTSITCKGLLAAEGYMFLGCHELAIIELSRIAENAAGYLCAVELMYARILLHLKMWEKAKCRIDDAIDIFPEEPEFRSQKMFVSSASGSPMKVIDVMNEMPQSMTQTGFAFYDLACYESLLGSKEASRLALSAAASYNPILGQISKTDPDLKDIPKNELTNTSKDHRP